jgi:PPOX class probable F420-dependent enzyme
VILTAAARSFLAEARRAILATIDPDGLPRLVPICFVLAADEDEPGGTPVLYSPLDEKPKAVADPRALARVRDILARPDVAILVDRWSEDWTELGWLRAYGRAELLEPDAVPPGTIPALRAKYPQYEAHDLASRPLLRIEIQRVVTWGAVEAV